MSDRIEAIQNVPLPKSRYIGLLVLQLFKVGTESMFEKVEKGEKNP